MRKFARNIFILLNFIAAFCLLISYTSVYINPAKFLLPAFCGLAYPYFLLVNFLFILLWLVFNMRYALISLLAIFVGFGFMGRFYQLSGTETDREDAINICSYNVKYFTGGGVSPTKESSQKIIDFLEEEKFDIICLQEANIQRKGVFDLYDVKRQLSNINHMQLAHTSRSGGPVTYTKYPIINMGEIRYEDSGNMVIYTDVKIDKDTVRVYNCHLQSYRILPHELNALDSLSFNKDGQYKGVKTLGYKMKQAYVKRAEQVIKFEEHLKKSPYPAIVCGDFNDTPVSFTYGRVRGDLIDAFIESGQGLGNTYNGKLPSFRIDYILHDEIFESFNFEVGEQDFSDHFPIKCKLIFRDK